MLAPLAATVGYLYTRAADRYPFRGRLLDPLRGGRRGGGRADRRAHLIGSGSASDADILYEYVRSQGIVEAIDAELDLRAIWSRAEGDPVFTVAPDAPIEALVAHWRRMVDVAFESAAGIIHVARPGLHARGRAGDRPGDPREVRRAGERALRTGARRRGALRPARSSPRPRRTCAAMRARLSEFRRANRIVDPSGDVAGQAGLLNALQAELAQALVERDVLLSFVGEDDQRVIQADRRITAVEGRIEAERASLGVSGAQGALPEVVGRYEELLVDLEFANTAYTQALGRPRRRAGRGAAAVALSRAACAADLRRERALPAPAAARGARRALPRARLGGADARLLQHARQPLSRLLIGPIGPA